MVSHGKYFYITRCERHSPVALFYVYYCLVIFGSTFFGDFLWACHAMRDKRDESNERLTRIVHLKKKNSRNLLNISIFPSHFHNSQTIKLFQVHTWIWISSRNLIRPAVLARPGFVWSACC